MKPKALTLLILTAIVMASVACGPSAKEQKELIQEQKTVLLCEDALERRPASITAVSDLKASVAHSGNVFDFVRRLDDEEKNLASIERAIDKYCK